MDTAITKEMYKEMGIDGKVYSFGQEIAESLKQRFEEIDRVAEYNQLKVVHAMQQCRASEACLYASSGYGYNDVKRYPRGDLRGYIPYRIRSGTSTDCLRNPCACCCTGR